MPGTDIDTSPGPQRGFLTCLSEYGDRLGLPPAMYRELPLRYVVQLSGSGKLLQVIDTADAEHKRGMLALVPSRRRSSEPSKPLLFADRLDYTFGRTLPPSLDAKVTARFAGYVEMVRACATYTKEPAVQAILRYLSDPDLELPPLPPDFDQGARITFSVEGVLPIELPSVRAFWAKVAGAGEGGVIMQCLVCGERRPAMRRLAIPVQGIPKGKSTGQVLIAMNERAFESYDLEASLGAPTCEDCGARFGTALNALLADASARLRMGDLIYIFWSRQPTPLSLPKLMGESDAAVIRQLFTSPRSGLPEQADPATEPFYAVGLSANITRVVVRDWTASTLGAVQGHLRRYFSLQQIVDRAGKPRFFPLWQLVSATVRAVPGQPPALEDANPTVEPALLRLALRGGPLPLDLLYLVVRRIHAEQQIRPSHAALMKMVLLSQSDVSWIGPGVAERGERNEGDELMVALDESCLDAAYLCGRLFALLEAIQYRALGATNSTVVTRYYTTASTRPVAAFAPLLRGAQAHLSKLRRTPEKRGAYVRLNARLQSLLEQFQEQAFPVALPVLQQCRFHLGYYHQRAADRAAMLEALARKGLKGKGEQLDEVALAAITEEAEVEGGEASGSERRAS
jgi:CRISPR-associated protein Csd1